MKSAMPYRGVTSVPLRAILAEVVSGLALPDRAAWEAAVLELWDCADYREERYAALAVAGHRLYRVHQDADTLALYRHLVVTGAWWDFVDNLASHHVGDILRASLVPAGSTGQRPTGGNNDPRPRELMRAWAVDEDLWLRRTAILCQLLSKSETDVDLLRHAVEQNLESSLHGREFFIRKACGWALRQHARIDPDWVRAFVAEHEDDLSGLTRREALKHLG